MTNSNSKFLSGCKKIADYIGETERRTFDLLSDGKIPAFKEGKLWRANKESLDRHYDKLESTFRPIGDAAADIVRKLEGSADIRDHSIKMRRELNRRREGGER
jgi:hypothetical protein